jgi:DNA repair ATPase RecN
MSISAEIKSKVTDKDVLAEFERLEQLLDDVTEESKSRKLKLRDVEKKLSRWKEVGIDPDGDPDDIVEKLSSKAKEGTKSVSEYDALEKKITKLTKDMAAAQQTAQENAKKAAIAEAKGAFAGKLAEHFGNASDLILESGLMKNQITVDENGKPGVMHDDEFYPLDKGKAIDALKKLYPQLVTTKQVKGGRDVSTDTKLAFNNKYNQMGRKEFDSLPFEKQAELMKNNVELLDSE